MKKTSYNCFCYWKNKRKIDPGKYDTQKKKIKL